MWPEQWCYMEVLDNKAMKMYTWLIIGIGVGGNCVSQENLSGGHIFLRISEQDILST